MCICQHGSHSSTRRPVQKTSLQKIRFIYIFQGSGILSNGCRKRLQSNRTSPGNSGSVSVRYDGLSYQVRTDPPPEDPVQNRQHRKLITPIHISPVQNPASRFRRRFASRWSASGAFGDLSCTFGFISTTKNLS